MPDGIGEEEKKLGVGSDQEGGVKFIFGGGQPLEGLAEFKYMGRVLNKSDND